MNDEKMLVSIIIPNWNTLEFSKKCVRSIQEHTVVPYEIILTDNGSTDGTVEWIKLLGYKSHFSAENKGFAAGCNRGIELAEGNFILLVCSDVEVKTKEWVRHMINTSVNLQADMVVPCFDNVGNPAGGYTLETYLGEDFVSASMSVPFTAVLMTRRLIDDVGLLDEETFIIGWGEDEDYWNRMILADKGYKAAVCRHAFCHHEGQETFKANNLNISELQWREELKKREKIDRLWGRI